MKCFRCETKVSYLKYIYGKGICRNCLFELLSKYGEYYSYGRFWIPRSAIKSEKQLNGNRSNRRMVRHTSLVGCNLHCSFHSNSKFCNRDIVGANH